MTEVRRATRDDVDGCVAVLAALPEYFTPDTHDDLRERFDRCTTYVAVEDDTVVGCVLLQPQYESAEIYYAGVVPERQRDGIGRRLIDALLSECNLAIVEVKTLDASANYEPYVATRAFWSAMGFIQIDCIDPLPGWNAGNPAAIYVCALRSTQNSLPSGSSITTHDTSSP